MRAKTILALVLVTLTGCAHRPQVKTTPIEREGLEGQIVFVSETNPGFLRNIFTSRGSLCTEVYTINADGSDETMLTDLNSTSCVPIWSPDGSKIAFFKVPARIPLSPFKKVLCVMDADGGQLKELGAFECSFPTDEDPLKQIFPPQWSPNGTKILVPSANGLHAVNMDGEEVILAEKNDLREAIWSPDGMHIVFTDGRILFAVDSAGANEQQITETERQGYIPFPAYQVKDLSWSHDGTRVALSYRHKLALLDFPALTLATIHDPSDLVGSPKNTIAVILDPAYSVCSVEWFPNDEGILFVGGAPNRATRLRSVATPTGTLHGYGSVCTIMPDGQGLVRLHREHECDVRIVSPSISPDGSVIALTSPMTNGSLWVISSDGTKGNEISRRADSFHPHWRTSR